MAVYASMACVKASMPLSAVTLGGHDSVIKGIYHGDRRPQPVGQDADLDVIFRIGDNAGGR